MAKKPEAKQMSRYAARVLKLIATILIVWLIGWRSPWARQDKAVRVDAPDAPKPGTVQLMPAYAPYNEVKPASEVADVERSHKRKPVRRVRQVRDETAPTD